MSVLSKEEACAVGAGIGRCPLSLASDVYAEVHSSTTASLRNGGIAEFRNPSMGAAEWARTERPGCSEPLRSASLKKRRQVATALEGAILTGVSLWETQRAGWSVKKARLDRKFVRSEECDFWAFPWVAPVFETTGNLDTYRSQDLPGRAVLTVAE